MSASVVAELKRQLDALTLDADYEPLDPDPAVRAVLDRAAANFRAGGVDLLDTATEYLLAYYRSIASAYGPEDRAEYGIPELADGDDIWMHRPTAI